MKPDETTTEPETTWTPADEPIYEDEYDFNPFAAGGDADDSDW